MIFFDTETCGLHGMAVLIQWAEDDGPIHLFNPWTNRIKDTLRLIEYFCAHPGGVCAYNLTFDWYMVQKMYNIFSLYPDHECYPEFVIDELALLELDAMEGDCIKPQTALDLMLFAMKGPYQSTMERKDLRIRKVPNAIAQMLADELENRIEIRDIFFSRRKAGIRHWHLKESKRDGKVAVGFSDVVLSFAASRGLKNVAIDALGLAGQETLRFQDVEVDPKFRPNEAGWAPYATAIGKPGDWKKTWPMMIQFHIDHWQSSPKAREYAALDVTYLRGLYEYFGRPPAGDDDSILCCCVASCRWRGYPIDIPKIQALVAKLEVSVAKSPKDHFAVKKMLFPLLEPEQVQQMKGSTAKKNLEEIMTWRDDDGKPTPAAQLCADIMESRKAQKQLEVFKKLLIAKKLHASFRVIGTLSGRMSGSDGLNAHAIAKADAIRECFFLHRNQQYIDYARSIGIKAEIKLEKLSGGDFSGFEVTLADAVYNDPDLRNDLLSGKKIHALFGQFVYRHLTYKQIVESDGQDPDYYTKCKQAFFALLYGAMTAKIAQVLGISEEEAELAYKMFTTKYRQVGLSRAQTEDKFCSMRQVRMGGQITWRDPVDYIESLVGFRRYFTLENMICRSLFDLGQSPPKAWLALKMKVRRRDEGLMQQVGNATRSALFGAAFAIQASNSRAGLNHVIQSTGSSICKRVQCAIWDLQPKGIHPFRVQPANFHDEINVSNGGEVADVIKETVLTSVESFRPIVPLIKMDWKKSMDTWAGKHSLK